MADKPERVGNIKSDIDKDWALLIIKVKNVRTDSIDVKWPSKNEDGKLKVQSGAYTLFNQRLPKKIIESECPPKEVIGDYQMTTGILCITYGLLYLDTFRLMQYTKQRRLWLNMLLIRLWGGAFFTTRRGSSARGKAKARTGKAKEKEEMVLDDIAEAMEAMDKAEVVKASNPKGAFEIRIRIRKAKPSYWSSDWSPGTSPIRDASANNQVGSESASMLMLDSQDNVTSESRACCEH
ncbi:hypothetical protein CAPTEDRAFT_219048 [Capitella teleta]|uniref:Uncharacterized protein n=1 Tax=Capitella teleta TaxID=283909 RepID=R7TDA3_CAPTE|nr:hypothetical protein CAPTEDRAFT_219048 [Capitella teleta]|eukprot:ELT91704.1 hypothetical protein CAPTEDRAFT_219048 [Capitella teleta]